MTKPARPNEFGSQHCPVGAHVCHPEHGWCDVVATCGLTRTLEAVTDSTTLPMTAEDLPPGVSIHELVSCRRIETRQVEVNVSTLVWPHAGLHLGREALVIQARFGGWQPANAQPDSPCVDTQRSGGST